MKLFDAFKQYIVKHPKVAAYKPTSADYDRDKLFAIVKKLATDDKGTGGRRHFVETRNCGFLENKEFDVQE